MASSYPLVDLPPLPAIDNPKALQIRGAESAPGNGDGAVSQAGRLGFGATAGNLGFGSTENFGFGSSAEKSEFGAAENLGVGSSADNLGFGGGGYGGGGGAGGKLRSSRRAKKTPYDRPAIGRHATPGGSAAMAAASMASSRSTITSRLRDSASWLISSSASYLFSAVFKRRVPAIKANGESHTAEGIAVKEDQEEETLKAPANQDDQNDECADQAPALDVDLKPAETEKRELDIGQVEEVLKRRTWSREQVNRLTEILQAHLCENADASLSLDAGRPPQEQPKKDTEGSTPVQVAQAYMGEQATRPPEVATSIHSPAYQSAEVQPSLGGRLWEDRYMSSPFSRTWAQRSVAVRMPKRSFVLADDSALMDPIRRVRQKTSMLTSTISYPYSRQMTGSSVPSRTLASPPPTQSSQTALRILETLEKMSPSPKGKLLEAATKKSPSDLRPLEKFSPPLKRKSLDESKVVAGISSIEQTPETSKAREKRVIQNPGLVVMPKSPEPNATGKPAFGGPASLESEATRNFINKSPALIPGSPIIIPERTKGFRMSAVFEESNSDEENKPHTKLFTSSETRHPTTLLNIKKAASLKPCVAPMAPVFSPTVDVSVSTTNSLPMPVQSSVSHAPESNSLPVTFSPPDLCEPSTVSPVLEKPTSNFTSFPTFSFPSAAMATGAPLSNAPASPPTVAAAVSVEKTATSASPSILAAPEKVPEQAVASTPSAAAASESAIAASSSSAAVITAVPALFGDISTIAPGALPPPVSTPSKTIATHEDLSEAENGVTMVTESPVNDKLTEVDTMATDSVAEEADAFIVAQSAPAFQSGLIHIASPASTFSFGASAMSSPSSAFSFAAGAPALSSSAATFAFGGQLGTVSAGQALTFGGMPSTPANPFSPSTAVNLNSGFVFGSSSAAASTSAVFTAKSSGLPSLTATSSTFQFGARATSSPLPIPFTSSGTTNSSAAFGFPSSPSPVSSATPTFLFGAGAASSQSSGSASAGQPFTFNAAQPNPFTANPFASFGAPNSAPAFQFGPPATAAAPSVFSSGSTGAPTASPTTLFGSNVVPNSSNTFLFGSNAASNSSSSFAFGSAQPAASPEPFTFGGQTAALPASGQPFGGGQPAMSAQSPFSAAGAAQASPDFAGGFALGATGGEKSGRKYIKPKRIGGAKRGK